MSRFRKTLSAAWRPLHNVSGGNTMSIIGAAVGGMMGGPMGASVGMGLGSLGDNAFSGQEEQRQLNKEQKRLNRLNRPEFIDPRQGRQSALSQFSVNPRQGRQGKASMLMNASSMYPSLLR